MSYGVNTDVVKYEFVLWWRINFVGRREGDQGFRGFRETTQVVNENGDTHGVAIWKSLCSHPSVTEARYNSVIRRWRFYFAGSVRSRATPMVPFYSAGSKRPHGDRNVIRQCKGYRKHIFWKSMPTTLHCINTFIRCRQVLKTSIIICRYPSETKSIFRKTFGLLFRGFLYSVR